MSKSYKDDSVFNLNDSFEEEVPVSSLEPKKDPEIRVVHKVNIVVLILLFLSFGLLLFSLYYAFFREKTYVNLRTIQDGDIQVIHSKASFGDTVESFIKYNSEEKAHVYTFTIKNDNEHELNYNIKIIEMNVAGINKINAKELSYSLYKNGNRISMGTIAYLNNNILANERTIAKEQDKYELKLWSNTSSKGYKYVIEVSD